MPNTQNKNIVVLDERKEMFMDKNALKKPILLLTYGMVLFFLLYQFEEVLRIGGLLVQVAAPFLIGGVLAFILNIPMVFFEKKVLKWDDNSRKKWKRPVSLILSLICAVAVVWLVVFLVVPELVHTVELIMEQIPKSIEAFEVWISTWNMDWQGLQDNVLGTELDIQSLGENLSEIAQGVIPTVFSSAFSVVTSTVNVVVNVVIGVVFAIYAVLSKEKLGEQTKKFLYAFLKESDADRVVYVSKLTHRTFKNFIAGQGLEAVILGSMFILTMSIAKLPYAVLVGVVIMVTSVIPIVGAFIGCVIGTFLILIVSPFKALQFLIIFLILQQIEEHFIYPYVVGNSVGLPSIWVLVSVSVGGGLMGVAGMILFIPLVSVIYTLVREITYKRLEEKNIPEDKWKKNE